MGFIACKKEISKNVDQDRIWTHYELFYDQNIDKTFATATFRFSSELGTRLMLSDPSVVLVDGVELEWKPESGFYQNQFNGSKDTAVFSWVDLDGNDYSNSVAVRPVSFPSAFADTLFYADSITYFQWQGTALGNNEAVALTLDGPGASDARIFSVDTFGATTISLDSLKLSQIDSGLVTAILEKRFSPILSEATSAGGLGVGRYRTTGRIRSVTIGLITDHTETLVILVCGNFVGT